MPKKYYSYCCLISHQLDLTFQKKEIENSYQINTFFKKVAQAKSLLTHQDLVEEMVNRVEKGAMPATEEFWLHLLYLYSKRDWEVCFGDERWGFKGFDIPDQYFHLRDSQEALSKLSKLKEIRERIEGRTPI